jgi:hypothetical protein
MSFIKHEWLKNYRMAPHWKEIKRKTEKTMDGGCVERLTNYENKKLETESHQ